MTTKAGRAARRGGLGGGALPAGIIYTVSRGGLVALFVALIAACLLAGRWRGRDPCRDRARPDDDGHLLRVVRGPRRTRSRHHGRGRKRPHRHLEGRLAHGRGQADHRHRLRQLPDLLDPLPARSRACWSATSSSSTRPRSRTTRTSTCSPSWASSGFALFLTIIGFAIELRAEGGAMVRPRRGSPTWSCSPAA